MGTNDNNPLGLTFREGTGVDWPQQIEHLLAGATVTSHAVDEEGWYRTVASNSSIPLVAERNGQIVGLVTLHELGPAEWWVEGLLAGSGVPNHVVTRSLLAHAITVFQEHGAGILRMGISGEKPILTEAMRALGMRRRRSFRCGCR